MLQSSLSIVTPASRSCLASLSILKLFTQDIAQIPMLNSLPVLLLGP
jgi:hypothetical protein